MSKKFAYPLIFIILVLFGLGAAQAERGTGENHPALNPSVGAACVDDNLENNDTPAAARPLAWGTYTPLARCLNDDDYFEVELPAGYEAVVELTFIHANGDLDIKLLNENGDDVASSGTSSNNEKFTYRAPERGRYVIHVYGYQNAENTYSLTISRQCSGCFSYQGILEDGGQPLNGEVDLRFTLYDKLVDGSQVGMTLEQQVTAVNGLVNTQVYFDRASYTTFPLFLEVAVRPAGGSYTTLSPRQELATVPVATTLTAGAEISGTGTSLYLTSLQGTGLVINEAGDDGIRIDNAGDDGIQIENVGDDGIYIINPTETGVWVSNAGKSAVAGENNSTAFPAGLFLNQDTTINPTSRSGGIGIYTRGANGVAADLVLGANDGTLFGDDGVITSDPNYIHSDIVLATHDKVVIKLDIDNNTSGAYFEILDVNGNSRFRVTEDGTITPANSVMAVNDQEESVGMYMLGATENRIEDFGSSTLANGTAIVPLAVDFANLIPADGLYHVYLTPLGDCPLFVANKTAAEFTVRAMGEANCTINFDYRIVATINGPESERLPQVTPLTSEEGAE